MAWFRFETSVASLMPKTFKRHPFTSKDILVTDYRFCKDWESCRVTNCKTTTRFLLRLFPILLLVEIYKKKNCWTMEQKQKQLLATAAFVCAVVCVICSDWGVTLAGLALRASSPLVRHVPPRYFKLQFFMLFWWLLKCVCVCLCGCHDTHTHSTC